MKTISYELDSFSIFRFWAKIDKKGENDCWNWLGGMRNKYGGFKS